MARDYAAMAADIRREIGEIESQIRPQLDALAALKRELKAIKGLSSGPARETVSKRIAEVLRSSGVPMSPTDIGAAAGVSPAHAQQELSNKDRFRRVSKGLYVVSDEGGRDA